MKMFYLRSDRFLLSPISLKSIVHDPALSDEFFSIDMKVVFVQR